jgi:hypothetical protein
LLALFDERGLTMGYVDVPGLCKVAKLGGIKAQDWSLDPGRMSRNLPDRRVASLWVRGTTSGTCNFTADGLTFHMPPNHGATTQGTTTLYAFQRIGSDVLVTWINGY